MASLLLLFCGCGDGISRRVKQAGVGNRNTHQYRRSLLACAEGEHARCKS